MVLGKLEPESNVYHRTVMNEASAEVVFPGGIYGADKLTEVIRMFAADVDIRQQKGEAGLLRYYREFTLDRHVENMSRIYDQL